MLARLLHAPVFSARGSPPFWHGLCIPIFWLAFPFAWRELGTALACRPPTHASAMPNRDPTSSPILVMLAPCLG